MAEESTRARLLETAGEVFAEKGYEAATVREICEKAGVNLAAVNYYFGGKELLYVQTLEAHPCRPSLSGRIARLADRHSSGDKTESLHRAGARPHAFVEG